jgi:hypothetical protein
MSEETTESHPLAKYDAEELKLVYLTLHRQLSENVDLMDSKLLADLQQYLHALAAASGVDVTDHGALDTWLGKKPVACENRERRSEALPPSRDQLN